MSKNNGEYAESVIGQSVKIEGDLISEGDLQIEGQVSGKVKTARNLFVGKSARIQADISAENATIAGTVDGDIKVASSLVILETGKVLGNAYCQTLGVKEGAFFSGQCNMGEQKSNHKGEKAQTLAEA